MGDDFYHYDPSAYYAGEDDASPAAPLIPFEFGASASASAPQRLIAAAISAAGPTTEATHSTAQVQTIGREHPLSDVNTSTRATLWVGLAVTTFVVTVCMRRYDPCY
jgi:hypothetical protein